MRDTDKVSCDARESREQKIDGKKTRRVAMLAAVAGAAGVSLASAQSSGEWRPAKQVVGVEAGDDFK